MKTRFTPMLTVACCLVAAGAAYAWRGAHKRVGHPADEDNMIGAPLALKTPLGLPPVPVPGNNPITAEKVALGRELFYDKRLSSDNSVSCSTCHNPLLGFTDGARHSTGVAGKTGKRNADRPVECRLRSVALLGWPSAHPRGPGGNADGEPRRDESAPLHHRREARERPRA